MRLGDIGEHRLIDQIVEALGPAAATDILVPPGDDAAAWSFAGGAVVATIDALVEGTHWTRDTMSLADVGWRAVAANVSDLAAMGALPELLLLATAVSPQLERARFDEFIEGLRRAAIAHGVRIAGGDIVRSDRMMVSITALGRGPSDDGGTTRLLRRDAARPGDVVAVSGWLGLSAAGLDLIRQGRGDDPVTAIAVDRHRRPVARTGIGRAAIEAGVRCAIDVSDGLVQDLGHVAKASTVSIDIDEASVPLHPDVPALLGRERALELALAGGEDFELVLVAPSEAIEQVTGNELPITVLGRVAAGHPGRVRVLDRSGRERRLAAGGWDPFRPSQQTETMESQER